MTPEAEVGWRACSRGAADTSLRCGRRDGFSGTPWYTSSTSVRVIAVPKISQDRIPQRFVDRDWRRPQRAEQLAEVPTILYFLKQKVRILVLALVVIMEVIKGFSPKTSFVEAHC